MRVVNWRIKENLGEHKDRIIANGVKFMEDVVHRARAACPIGNVTREGKFVTANVEFVRKRGKGKVGKGTIAKFRAERWQGRDPGDLIKSIRLVQKGGSIRVYAGNYKIYYAFMVERGTIHTRKQPFLRPAFFAAKGHLMKQLKEGRANELI